MTTFPITYIVVVLYLILITFSDENYWTRFGVKLLGAVFGIWTAIYTFNGEWWLFIDSNGVFTLSQFKDNFQLPIALIILGSAIILWFMLIFSLINRDWEKGVVSSAEN